MRKSGINKSTPKDMLLGAGTVFKNLKYLYNTAGVEAAGSLEVVADGTTVGEGQIALSMLTNPGVSFIGVAENFTPKAGDHVKGAWVDSEENVLGATNGGNKLSIVSELMPIEVDGATVKIKGMTQKIGETGSIEVNLVQHTVESLKRAIVGKEVKSLIPGYVQIQTKSLLELSDYLDNIAFVGNMTDGTDVVIIMENAICTSGLELEGKNKETSVVKTTFEPTADFEGGVFDTLPIYIFYPEKSAE